MSMLGTIAHVLGANGYVKTQTADRISFSNARERLYQFEGKIQDPPGSGTMRTVYFTNPLSVKTASEATQRPSGATVFNTRPGP